MTPSEMRRREYRLRRYLDHLSQEEIEQRIKDICCNAMTLTAEGKMAFRQPNEGGAYWMELFSHVQEELVLRNAGFTPGFMADAILPKPTWPMRPKNAEITPGKKLEPGRFLVKYGKYKHLKDGSLRIGPASGWKESQNPAIHDDELKKRFLLNEPMWKFKFSTKRQ